MWSNERGVQSFVLEQDDKIIQCNHNSPILPIKWQYFLRPVVLKVGVIEPLQGGCGWPEWVKLSWIWFMLGKYTNMTFISLKLNWDPFLLVTFISNCWVEGGVNFLWVLMGMKKIHPCSINAHVFQTSCALHNSFYDKLVVPKPKLRWFLNFRELL